jgi:hypothetical protein
MPEESRKIGTVASIYNHIPQAANDSTFGQCIADRSKVPYAHLWELRLGKYQKSWPTTPASAWGIDK